MKASAGRTRQDERVRLCEEALGELAHSGLQNNSSGTWGVFFYFRRNFERKFDPWKG